MLCNAFTKNEMFFECMTSLNFFLVVILEKQSLTLNVYHV